MPPPPVAGAAEGTGLADRRGLADGLGVAAGLADAAGLAEGLPLALGPVRLAVPLGRMAGDTDPVTPGENVAGVAGGGDPEQAAADAAARMVKVAQPTAANLVLSPVPAMVMRIFTGPPGGL